MTIYNELQAVAGELLQEFDQGSIKLISSVAGSGDADEPGAATETTHTLYGAARGVSFKYVRDGFAVSTDIEVTVGVLENVTPSINDFIEIGGSRYKIIQDVSSPAAGTRCVWKFIVRKGA